MVQRFIDGFGSGRWTESDVVLGAVADDAEWWIAGRGSRSGDVTKQIMAERFRGTAERAASGLVLTPRAWIVEGNRAAVELAGSMELQDGSVYTNQYHFAFTVEGDQIVEIREYWDTSALD
ncbi:nuclear transport factor 2 family protein [Rhodococcus sp. T2V]|uniref:nuclear transport factor 2 family protein n=1 Tax=Rhodococcus sp. T2V TaxID=3034164 RepID=UPI0023E1E88F|nr:nuclear transport factor 2 family protein [Rhodococcus sp. T2V]MDF3309655.1 nuclear transport factor 2 family protein [Rhodococcus sp. T2V]